MNFGSSFSMNSAVRRGVRPGDLHVDRRGQAEIQYLADDVRRQELELRGGVGGREPFAQLALIILQGGVLLREVDEDVGIARAHRRRGAVREVDAAVGQTEVVDDGGDLARLDDLADRLFHLIAQNGGFLDARAGGRAQMQLDLPAVDGREEILAEAGQRADGKGEQRGRGHREQEDAGEAQAAVDRKGRAAPGSRGASARSRARIAPESAPEPDLLVPLCPRPSSSARTWPASGPRFATGCRRPAWRTPRPRRAE